MFMLALPIWQGRRKISVSPGSPRLRRQLADARFLRAI